MQHRARDMEIFFLLHLLLLHASNLYTNEYGNSVRDSYKKTQHCVILLVIQIKYVI
jgi:hypothetical protein